MVHCRSTTSRTLTEQQTGLVGPLQRTGAWRFMSVAGTAVTREPRAREAAMMVVAKCMVDGWVRWKGE